MIRLGVVVVFALVASGALAADPPRPKAEQAAAALMRGDTEQAVSLYTEALDDPALPNDRRGVVLNDRGVAYLRLGRVKLAIEDFNKAVQLFPEYAAIYNNRGNLLLGLSQHKEAIKDFDRAIQLAPGYAAAYNNRAGAYLALGQTSDAIRDYSAAIRLAPSSAAPFGGRGRAYLALNRPRAAIRDFSRAVGSDARFASAYRSRAEATMQVGTLDGAIEDLSRAIAFDINNPELYVLRGHAYLASSTMEAAVGDFTRAIELAPDKASGYEGRGLAHGLLQNYEGAFADLNKALEIDPKSAVAFAYRAFVYKQNGQLDVGQKDIETAVKIDAERPEVLWAKGELEDAAGQHDAAIASLKRALALKPSLKLAKAALGRLGVDAEAGEDKPEPALGLDAWQVVSRGTQYFAVNETYPRLRIPLETLGEGLPKVLDWELKQPPLKGIGVLRFYGGKVEGKSGPEDVELAAIVDLNANTVVAVEINKQGSKTANWTWDQGKVVVASADGLTDEYSLRAVETRSPEDRPRRAARDNWSPFGDNWGERRPRRRYRTIFDLLFN